MPGPKGYIHGWIYVGGAGLPSPGSPDAPDTPRWAPGTGPASGAKPLGAGWRKQNQFEKARTDFPSGSAVRFKSNGQTGVVREVRTEVNTGRPVVIWHETRGGVAVSGPHAHPPDKLELAPTGGVSKAAGDSGGTTSALGNQALNRAAIRGLIADRTTNKARAAEIADKLIARHGGDPDAAIEALDAGTPDNRRNRSWELKRNALLARSFSKQNQQIYSTPEGQSALARPPAPRPRVEDLTSGPRGPQTGPHYGETAQTSRGAGKITGVGGGKTSVELSSGEMVVVPSSEIRPVPPVKGKRATWMGSGISGKVVEMDATSVTIEHREGGNTVRKRVPIGEVTGAVPKAGVGQVTTPPVSTGKRLTRGTAHRGDRVQITLKDGKVLTGQLTGWGAQILELKLDPESKRTVGRDWKRDSFSTTSLQAVVAAP